MIALRMSEDEYGQIPVDERARKVVGMKLESWMKILESNKFHQEMERKRNARSRNPR